MVVGGAWRDVCIHASKGCLSGVGNQHHVDGSASLVTSVGMTGMAHLASTSMICHPWPSSASSHTSSSFSHVLRAGPSSLRCSVPRNSDSNLTAFCWGFANMQRMVCAHQPSRTEQTKTASASSATPSGMRRHFSATPHQRCHCPCHCKCPQLTLPSTIPLILSTRAVSSAPSASSSSAGH